jgi:dihydrofolate reductase
VAHSIDDALERARSDAERRGVNRVYVAGGGNVYAQFLDDADVLELTELEDAYEGDTAFPTFDTEKWAETARETHEKYDFVTYERVETSN